MKNVFLQLTRLAPAALYAVALVVLLGSFSQAVSHHWPSYGALAVLSAPDGSPAWHTGPEYALGFSGGKAAVDFTKKPFDGLFTFVRGYDLPSREPLSHYSLRALDFPVLLQQMQMLFPFHFFL